MAYQMDADGERRLEGYLDGIGELLGSSHRRASFAMYVMGLLSESERKEPVQNNFSIPRCLPERPKPVPRLQLIRLLQKLKIYRNRSPLGHRHRGPAVG